MDSRERLHARGHVHCASDEVILHPLARARQADKPQTTVKADPQSKGRQPLPPQLDMYSRIVLYFPAAVGCAHQEFWAIYIQNLPATPSYAPASGQADKGRRDDLAGKLARREVQRSPLSIPGREMVQVETLIPAGVDSGWHVHPGEEVGYIIAGQVEMRVQGRATVVLRPGDGFLIPPRTPHNARDIGPETGKMLSTYIVETGQPIATFVDQPVQR